MGKEVDLTEGKESPFFDPSPPSFQGLARSLGDASGLSECRQSAGKALWPRARFQTAE